VNHLPGETDADTIARLAATIDAFQTASGLCVPPEEDGGDPGGVTPKHVADEFDGLRAEVARLRALLNRKCDECGESPATHMSAELLRGVCDVCAASDEEWFTPIDAALEAK